MARPKPLVRWLMPVIRAGLHWLYTRGAWAYDAVAWLVSGGHWQDWVRSMALWPEAQEGTWVLELGVGPGHLQVQLAELGFRPVGVDPSPYMLRRARRRLRRAGHRPRLVRARAQALPFPSERFHRVVATFPTEYVFDARTVEEVWRVLKPGGRFDILLSASGWLLTRWERWLGGDEHAQEMELYRSFRPAARLGALVYIRRYPLPHGAWGWVVTLYKPAQLEDVP